VEQGLLDRFLLIKYKATCPVQFENSRNKGLGRGKNEQPFWEKNTSFWGKSPFRWEREIFLLGRRTLDLKGEKVEAHSEDWGHSSYSYSSIQSAKE